MKTVKIEVPTDTCEKCPCFILTKAAFGNTEREYFLCRAFNKMLAASINGVGMVTAIMRCKECKDAEVQRDA